MSDSTIHSVDVCIWVHTEHREYVGVLQILRIKLFQIICMIYILVKFSAIWIAWINYTL